MGLHHEEHEGALKEGTFPVRGFKNKFPIRAKAARGGYPEDPESCTGRTFFNMQDRKAFDISFYKKILSREELVAQRERGRKGFPQARDGHSTLTVNFHRASIAAI